MRTDTIGGQTPKELCTRQTHKCVSHTTVSPIQKGAMFPHVDITSGVSAHAPHAIKYFMERVNNDIYCEGYLIRKCAFTLCVVDTYFHPVHVCCKSKANSI